jgi:flagellar hook-basal body complex protein FliE
MLPLQNASALLGSLLQKPVPSQLATSTPLSSPASSNDIFGGMWRAAAEQIKDTDAKAQQAVTGLLSGKGVEVHDAIIATQKADMSFELALQVRNKAVAAYQQMMTMQF